MNGFFSLEGPFYKYGSILADMMIIGLLWFFCSIPIVTCGAATTSMYYVMTRKLSDREGYIFRDFFESFKRNFKTATLAWLAILLVAGILVLNIFNIGLLGNMANILLPFQIVFLIEILVVSIYIFPVLSRFDVKFGNLFKTAFFMANKHLLTTFTCLVLFLGCILLSLYILPFILIAGGVFSYVASILFMRVFRKYRPEMDKDELEYQLELETAKARAEEKAKKKEERQKRRGR